MKHVWLLLLVACPAPEPAPPEPEVVCGDGEVGVGEACDDANPWYGDGCSPDCTAESLPGELEPNDTWDAAAAWEGGPSWGALPAGDIDCWQLSLETCGAVEATLTSVTGACGDPLTLSLHDPSGARVATGRATEDACAVLDPVRVEGARMGVAGDWALCVSALQERDVWGYQLEARVLDVSEVEADARPGSDLDDDGLENGCDPDRDGDGVPDEDDLCPDDASDGEPWALTEDGYARDWLLVGPLTGRASTDGCLPTLDDLLGDDDASASPQLGDRVGNAQWHVHRSGGDRINLRQLFGSVDAPREVYGAVWLKSDAPREVTLSMGLDDGARVWWNGALVSEVSSCQGTNRDQFQVPVDLTGGWDRLVIKVYDQGGGWGMMARLLEDDEPVTDVDVSLSMDGVWPPEPADSDGDGLGDLCDPTPSGRN